MSALQGMLQMLEVGKGTILVRLVPLLVVLAVVGLLMDFSVYHGLKDAQSMDNAQLARQIVRGQGFTTEFLRPHAVSQMQDFASSQGLVHELYPATKYPPGTPRILPDTYNAPGYPYLLATWFYLLHPEFSQTWQSIATRHIYSPDRWIPFLNQIFFLLTAGLVFLLGRRLFDTRVAWLAFVSFLVCDLVWKYTISGLSTTFLTFLITAAFYGVVKIFCVGEDCFESEENSFAPAWFWGLGVAVLLLAAALTRLHFMVVALPVAGMLLLMPRANVALPITILVLVLVGVAPWFLHLRAVSGSPVGSNGPLMLLGTTGYEDNEIFCSTTIPSYEQFFKEATRKEYLGIQWHLEHAWSLLGSSPMVLLFAASILHQFRRRRTRLFHWMIFASALVLVLANNLGTPNPDDLGPWNALIVLFPAMVVVGTAFFFILLDRLSLQLWLLNNFIVTGAIAISAIPLILNLTTASNFIYAFPPYMPPIIRQFSQYAQPDEWVTSDMPWATAWYGDRASLWLPDSLTDFNKFHDNVCPTGMLMFTPVTWGGQISAVSVGEYKDWYSLMLTGKAPTDFPLPVHTATGAGGPDYSLWSDRPRWQVR